MYSKNFQECIRSLDMATLLASRGNIDSVMKLLDKEIPGTLTPEQAKVVDAKLDVIAGHFFAAA